MTSSTTTNRSNSNSNSTNNNKPPLFCLVDTETTVLQKQAEKECQPYFVELSKLPADQKAHLRRIGLLQECDESDESGKKQNDGVQLLRDKHRRYLEGVWKRPLKAPFVSLDSSRPWMLYWCLHGYDLLSTSASSDSNGSETEIEPTNWITSSEGSSMVSTLEDCWQGYHTRFSEIPEIIANDGDYDEDDDIYFALHEDDENRIDSDKDNEEAQYYCGGFGGGPAQQAHAACTYAAVLALCILATSKSNNNHDKGETTNINSDTNKNEINKNNNDGDDDDDDDDNENRSYSSLHYSDRARRILSEIRIPLYRWMVSLQVPSTGGYRMQHDGEVDVRATYTIACCSKLLGLLETPTKTNTTSPPSPAKKNFTVLGRPLVIDFVKSCQTYEGGMGGEPFSEAHGGYTFCAVAALKLLGALGSSSSSDNDNDSNSSHGFDVSALLGWLGRRQLSYEGGFSGRSNKLVDGCYSFWQGGAMAIASSCSECLAGEEDKECGDDADDPWLARYRKQQKLLQQHENTATNPPTDAPSTSTTNNADDSDNNNNSPPPNLPFPLLYDVFLLERYILLCAQEVTGGLRDKPSKPRDFYHTCYNLSGLSIAQHSSSDDENETEKSGFGDPKQTLVEQTHPCYNIRIDRVATILEIDWGE